MAHWEKEAIYYLTSFAHINVIKLPMDILLSVGSEWEKTGS